MSEAKILRDITAQSQNVFSNSSESDMSETEVDSDTQFEQVVKDATAGWLAIHGAKLFALETSKFLAIQEKKKNLRSNR